MSWIRLTGYRNGNESAVHCEKLKGAILDRVNDYTVIVFENKTMKVRETIDEIIEQFKDEQDSEWIKNTGKAPDGDLVIEAKLIGDASTFDFDLNSFLPINEYQILGTR